MVANNPRLHEIRKALGSRRLVWFGTRGTDALGLDAITKPLIVISQIAPIPQEQSNGIRQDCLELRSKFRRDLDSYDIDTDFSKEARGLKNEFLADIDEPILLAAYRTARMLASPTFCKANLLLATNFHLMQRQFEYKPWVEMQLHRYDDSIPLLQWTYVQVNDFEAIRRLTDVGPLVGRTSTGAGGKDIFEFSTELEFKALMPKQHDGFVSISTFLHNATPLNVNACVYSSGEVGVFALSYQIIGVEFLTRRRFGFCGNDFCAAADLPKGLVDNIERITKKTGGWLARNGYTGLFGLDILLHNGEPLITEINPRFQGSTPLSASINQTVCIPDPFSEHIAAFLGLECPVMPSCFEQIAASRDLLGERPVAQVVHRNTSLSNIRAVACDEGKLEGITLEAVPTPDIYIQPEAMIFKSLHRQQVTSDGYSVVSEVEMANRLVATAL